MHHAIASVDHLESGKYVHNIHTSRYKQLRQVIASDFRAIREFPIHRPWRPGPLSAGIDIRLEIIEFVIH